MAKEFFGCLHVQIDTDVDVSDETFKKFKKDFIKMVENDWEMMLYDLASKHGFEIENMHPIMESSDYKLSAIP